MSIERPFKQGSDFDYFTKMVRRENAGGPVPLVELMVDGDALSAVTGQETPFSSMLELMKLVDEDGNVSQESMLNGLKIADLSLSFSKAAGYDYAWSIPVVPIPRTRALLSRESEGVEAKRCWQDEHDGLIPDRRAFDHFPWPPLAYVNILPIDYMAASLPPGMKIMLFYMGVFEDLRALMGFEAMAVKSIEEPELLGDILERLTVLAERAVDMAAAHPSVGAVFYADDMGFNTSTMLSPDFFREWVIPRQKRIADVCHKHGKPFLFHSCGQIDALMDDFIDTVGIDGIHSFQDNIEPVESVYDRYHGRVSILGGVDVDLLAKGTVEQVRKRCREILDHCAPGGGFAIGSGNSVTNYCKIENYYAMLDEAREWNKEHGF